MNAASLTAQLLEAGCSRHNFAVQSRQHDAFCLDHDGQHWSVFYSERGTDSPPIYKSSNEADACRFFYDYITKQEHWHLVGFYEDESEALELAAKLEAEGIACIRNDIPAYKAPDDPRFRVFVVGRDIFKARERLGSLIDYRS